MLAFSCRHPNRADGHRRKLITEAARELERSKMARFDERSGNLYVTGEQVLTLNRRSG